MNRATTSCMYVSNPPYDDDDDVMDGEMLLTTSIYVPYISTYLALMPYVHIYRCSSSLPLHISTTATTRELSLAYQSEAAAAWTLMGWVQ